MLMKNVIEKAQNWLISQQRADGSFTKKYYYEKSEDASTHETFHGVCRADSLDAKAENGTRVRMLKTLCKRRCAFLKTRNAEIDEPYALALFGLASFDAGNAERRAKRRSKDSKQWRLPKAIRFTGNSKPTRRFTVGELPDESKRPRSFFSF